MDQDKVTRALGVINDEVKAIIEELNNDGAQAFRRGNYEDVDRLRRMGEELAVFNGSVEQLQTQWVSKFAARNDSETRSRPKTDRPPSTLTEETAGDNGSGLLDRLEQFK